MAGDRPKLIPEVLIQESPQLHFVTATPEQLQTYAFLKNNLRISPRRCLELRCVLDNLIGTEIQSYRGTPARPDTFEQIKLVVTSIVTRFLELRDPARVEVTSSRIPGEGSTISIKFLEPSALYKLFETNWGA